MKNILMISLLAVSSASFASVYGFEDLSPGFPASVTKTVDSVTFTVSRLNGGIWVFDGSGNSNANWGSRYVWMDPSDTPDKFVIDFDTELSSVGIDIGDWNADEDDVFLQAFDGAGGTGNMVGSDTAFLAGSDDLRNGDYATLTTAPGSGIRSILVWGEGFGNNNNVAIDNLEFEAVPEPATMTLLGLGALAALRKKKARK